MTTTNTYLPEAALVERGSPAMEDLEFTLVVLRLHLEDRLDEIDAHWVGDVTEAFSRAVATLSDITNSWDYLCPDGARRYYEGDDPDGFRAEMRSKFGFDPADDDPEFPPGGWCEERGWVFTIPAGLVEAIYGNERWPLGS